jgi:hypothetical protein
MEISQAEYSEFKAFKLWKKDIAWRTKRQAQTMWDQWLALNAFIRSYKNDVLVGRMNLRDDSAFDDALESLTNVVFECTHR